MILVYALLMADTLQFIEPNGTIFAGNTRVVIETSVEEEQILGLELFLNGQSVYYSDLQPFETTIDFRQFPSGPFELKAVLTLFDRGPIATLFHGKNIAEVVSEKVVFVRVPVHIQSDEVFSRPLVNTDFQLKENGHLQSIERTLAHREPLRVVLVLDMSGSMAERMVVLKRGVVNFLGLLNHHDEVALIGFNHRIYQIQDFERDKKKVRNRLITLRAEGDTNLYGALWSGIALAAKSDMRRAVMVFTDGDQTLMSEHDTTINKSLEEGIQLARYMGVPVYTVGVGMKIKPDILAQISNQTGGKSFILRGKTSIVSAFESIAALLQFQYLLCYYSESTHIGWHEIEIGAPFLNKAELTYPKQVYFK